MNSSAAHLPNPQPDLTHLGAFWYLNYLALVLSKYDEQRRLERTLDWALVRTKLAEYFSTLARGEPPHGTLEIIRNLLNGASKEALNNSINKVIPEWQSTFDADQLLELAKFQNRHPDHQIYRTYQALQEQATYKHKTADAVYKTKMEYEKVSDEKWTGFQNYCWRYIDYWYILGSPWRGLRDELILGRVNTSPEGESVAGFQPGSGPACLPYFMPMFK